MTISWQTPGAVAYSAPNGASVAPAYPASSVEGDKLILVVGQKPATANGGGVTTPASWNLVTSLTAAGGYGTTLGADTGNTNIYVYERTVPAGGLSGTLSVTVTNNNVCWATMMRVTTASGGWTSVAGATGSDTTAGSVSVTCTTDPDTKAGDLCIAAMVIPTDVTTPVQFSAEAFTQTGVTFGTVTEITEPDSTTGSDIGGFLCYATATAGESSAAPTVTATAGGTTTNVRGPLAFVRIRDNRYSAGLIVTESGSDTISSSGNVSIKGSLAASESGADTLSGPGKVIIQGALTVSETSADTFSSSGKVIVKGSLAATETGTDTFAGSGKVIVHGTFAVSEPSADTLSSTGQVVVQGSVSATEAADTLSSTGHVVVQGDLSVAESTDTLTSTGLVTVHGSLSATESGSDIAYINGGDPAYADLDYWDWDYAEGDAGPQGNLVVFEVGADTFDASGIVVHTGVMAVTETGVDVFSATGSVAINGTMAVTETGADTFSAYATLVISGSLAVSESDDAFAGSGQVIVAGSVSATESGSDTLYGRFVSDGYVAAGYVRTGVHGYVLVQGAFNAVELTGDTFSATGSVAIYGTMSAFEALLDSFEADGRYHVAPDWLTLTGELRAYQIIGDARSYTVIGDSRTYTVQ